MVRKSIHSPLRRRPTVDRHDPNGLNVKSASHATAVKAALTDRRQVRAQYSALPAFLPPIRVPLDLGASPLEEIICFDAEFLR